MPTINQRVGVETDKQNRARVLPTRLTAAYRLLAEKYLAMPGDNRTGLAQPWRFANFATADRRYDPILGLLTACADCAHDPKRRAAVREFAAEIKDALDALCADEQPRDFVESLHRESRAQGVADPAQSELTAHPNDPTKLQRFIVTGSAHMRSLGHSITAARQHLARVLPIRSA